MRLIDADAMLEHLRKDPLFPLVEQYGLVGVIDAMPTVDAVPLEWIKRRIEGLNNQAENSTDDNIWAEFAREAFALEKILKFWAERKEE